MQDQPVATNKWFSNAIFTQYTGELWVYPQMVEADLQGVRISSTTGFSKSGTRAVDVKTDASIMISGNVDLTEDPSTIIILDFEDGGYPDGWVATGDFLTYGPRTKAEHNHSGNPENFFGDYYFDSFFKGDFNMGTLTSPEFEVKHDYLHFLIAGGSANGAEVRLMTGDDVIYRATGKNGMSFEWVTWDLRSHFGENVKIVIADETTAGWGYIACDNFVLSNSSEVNSSFSNSFWPEDAKAYDWTELGFTFSLLDDVNRGMITSLVHGVPFTYIDINEIYPTINTSHTPSAVYNKNGNAITTFPQTTNTVILEVNGELFGVHAPVGTVFNKINGQFSVAFSESVTEPYLVISNIPDLSLITTYDDLARNKITQSSFGWEVDSNTGKIKTSFILETKNYDTGITGGSSIMSFIPHQWRNTVASFSYINKANYSSLLGEMKSGQGNDFTFSYDFTGMPPFMPEPKNLTDVQQTRLADLIKERAKVSAGYNGNSYAKGFGEESNMMLMAKELNLPEYDILKTNLKNELIDWFTFSPEEATKKSYYFAEYPQYGALVAFPPGYGSQGFNDLHFHNGYFIIGAARLMMVDDDFKAQYGEMTKLVARSYANWLRYGEKDDVNLPFMRTFDPYFGHSFAGGTGDGGGNNQESTSEALNSWFGIYLLGVALDDQEIMAMGATGFKLEGTAADYYWFNRYGDLPVEFPYDYVGILRTNNLSMATYFHGDPAWAFGIQFVPCDNYYNYIYDGEPAHYRGLLESMIDDRINTDDGYFTSNDLYENIKDLGPYLGGYIINYLQLFDSQEAANMLDDLYQTEGGEWTSHVNSATNYYVANVNQTYGKPAAGYYTNSVTSTVFENSDGELSYILYNPSDKPQDIVIYNPSGIAIETITVGPKVMYNSKEPNPIPQVSFIGIKEGDIFVQDTPETLSILATDKDDNIENVEIFIDGISKIILQEEPYEYLWTPSITGEIKLVAKVIDADGQSNADSVVVKVIENNQLPYNGTPFSIPSDIIPAVEWDYGGERVAYHDEDELNNGNGIRQDEGVDTEGGAGLTGNIGWVRPGEWIEYTIMVTEAAKYDIGLNYSSAYGGGEFYLSFDGENITPLQYPLKTNSWADYQNHIISNVYLSSGEKVMRIFFEAGGINLKSFAFKVNDDVNTAVKEIEEKGKVSVVPNPVGNNMQVCFDEKDYNSLRIFSISGNLVHQQVIENKRQECLTIDMSGFYPGFYLLELCDSKGECIIVRIIKE